MVHRGLEARKNRAVEVQEGLQGLVHLLSPDQDVALRHDALSILAAAKNADRHYMSGIGASGEDAERRVRSSFGCLLTCLVNIVRESKGRSEALVAAASALTVAVDAADMSCLVQTGVMELLEEYWQGDEGWCSGEK